ncbi:unnamed protein product [Boreogadus saida]
MKLEDNGLFLDAVGCVRLHDSYIAKPSLLSELDRTVNGVFLKTLARRLPNNAASRFGGFKHPQNNLWDY